jgi:hypothetical protein
MVYMARLRIGKAAASNPLAPLAFVVLLVVAAGRDRAKAA